ncbi:hypothetical protein FB451DRAFT_1360618, partial [Mycena latifolia]
MPPFTRQQTIHSVHSQWSDSNPPGATINLHAVAKPLMRLMYHRQALAFIKRNDGVPLTPVTLEIYWSYVSWKYVSTSTKLAVLAELRARAGSKEDARLLIYSNMVDTILQFLQSRRYPGNFMHWQLIWESQAILVSLTRHNKSTCAAVVEPVVALLGDDVKDGQLAFDLLRRIADSSEGAEGIVAANALHYLLDGLASPSVHLRLAVFQLMDALLQHESAAAAVINHHPCKQLVTLSSTGESSYEALLVFRALVAIANWPDGGEAAVAAQVLDHVPTWFASQHSWRRELTFRLLENLARHKSTAPAV